MSKFTESDVKEAIRMVLQDWLGNEHGTIATQDHIDEFYKKLLEWKRTASVLVGAELKTWLQEQPELQKRSELLYTFKYKDIWCAGIVTIQHPFDFLRIMPANTDKDIGKGCGCGINMQFNRG